MFGLSKEEKAYKKIFNQQCDLARSQARDYGLNLERTIESVLVKNSVPTIRPRPTATGLRVYTPRQISGVVSDILGYPNPMSSYMVLYCMGPAVIHLSLPIEIQGDIAMAFEKIRAIKPEAAERGAEYLAHALCMMPNLKRARETYRNLGVPFTEGRLDEKGIQKLLKEQLVAESEVSGNRVLWDVRIKSLVGDKLLEIDEYIAHILGADEPIHK